MSKEASYRLDTKLLPDILHHIFELNEEQVKNSNIHSVKKGDSFQEHTVSFIDKALFFIRAFSCKKMLLQLYSVFVVPSS